MARPSRPGPRLAAAAAVLLTVTACGGAPAAPAAAPGSPPAPAAEGPAPEFCDAYVQIDTALAAAPPPGSPASDQGRAVLARLQPLFATAAQTAPADLADDVAVLTEAATQGLGGGTPPADAATAEDAVDDAVLAGCGFTETAVTAADFEYQGVPDSFPAGPGAVTLTNEGSQVHEFVLARIDDDVPLSGAEVLALPMEQAMESVELVGRVFAAPGETETTFVAPGPGRYVAACSVPEGTTSFQHVGSGPPHFAYGMLAEFTVA